MASQLLPFGTDSMDPAAAAQQLALCQCTYSDDVDAIRPMLAPDGVILNAVVNHDTWPPNHVLIKVADGDYVLCMSGTTALYSQGLWHIWGSYVPGTEGGAYIHGQWQQAYEDMYALLLTYTGEPSSLRLRVSGHSYGGAIAQLIAERAKSDHPAWNVQCITYGAPRARGRGYTGPALDAYWRVEATGDLVPSLPPGGTYPTISLRFGPPAIFLDHFDWMPYGTQAVLYPGGTLDTPSAAPDPPPPGLYTAGVAAHYPADYWARLKLLYETLPADPLYVQALNIMGDLLGQGSPLTVPPALPMGIPLPGGPTVPNPLPFAPFIGPDGGFFPGVRAMATPFATPSAFKVIWNYQTADPDGWSESMYLGIPGESVPNLMKPTLAAYAPTRLAALTSAATLGSVRVSRSDPSGKGISQVYIGNPTVGCGDGTGGAIRSQSNVDYFFRIKDITGRYGAILTFRGLAEGSAQMAAGVTRQTQPLPSVMRNVLNQINSQFIGQNTARTSPYTLLIRSVAKDPAGPQPIPVDSIIIITGTINIRVVGGISGAVIGSRVILSHTRQKCQTGFSGPAKIVGIYTNTPETGITQYTLDRCCCCNDGLVPGVVVGVRLANPQYYQANSIEYAGFSARKTGRPSGARTGRRRIAGC